MKRSEFLKHLRMWGCFLKREGANHSVYFNARNRKMESIPRHAEIDNDLVRGICRRLEIPSPWEKRDDN